MKVGDGTPGPGRPKGKLNKTTEEYLAFGQSVLESDEWKASAKQRMIDGDADHLEQYFSQRLHGKPREIVELQSTVPLFSLPVGAFVAIDRPSDRLTDGVPDPLDGSDS